MKINYLYLMLCFGLTSRFLAADLAPEIIAPFEEVVNRFLKSEWVNHFVTKKEFDSKATKLLAFLKKNQKDWQTLADPKASLSALVADRAAFEKRDYILRVFNTKPGTLIFQMKEEPQIIIKIDNRLPESFDANFRSYYDAFEKNQEVQKNFQFPQLFLPYEYGRDSKEAKVKFVFSEKVPLFSDAEIDNMILMHIFHRKADANPRLKTELKAMFEEMLLYICRVDFDDINFRNVPFTLDGRLAPFDTDSFRAQTGVFSFLKEYAGFKIFDTYASVKPVVASSCVSQPRESSTINPYLYTKSQQDLFAKNEIIFNEMMKFFEKKPLWRGKIKGPQNLYHNVAPGMERTAAVIDSFVERNLVNPNANKHTPGRRCHHMKDILAHTNPAASEVNPGKSLEEVDRVIADILNQGKAAGIVYSHGTGDIFNLKNVVEGLAPFVCF